MIITEYAINAIIAVMESRGLDPESCYFGIKQMDNESLGIGFSEDKEGEVTKFGKLSVTIPSNINSEGVVIDFGEIDGKRGLVFLSEEEYLNNQGDKQHVAANN